MGETQSEVKNTGMFPQSLPTHIHVHRVHASSLTAEVLGATHTTSNSKYVSCPADLLLFFQPLATRALRAHHVLASPAFR